MARPHKPYKGLDENIKEILAEKTFEERVAFMIKYARLRAKLARKQKEKKPWLKAL